MKFEEGNQLLVRIVAPYFVAGVEVGVRAAPIVKYMQNWSLDRILEYCARKEWTVQVYEI